MSVRAALRIGVEVIPWAGLALLLSVQPLSALRTTVPQAPVVLPLLIFLGGSLLVLARQRWLAVPSAEVWSPMLGLQPSSNSSRAPSSSETTLLDDSPTEQFTDTLRSLADRTALLDALAKCLGRAAEDEPTSPALITLRITEYREVTESFGHQAGQDLMTAVAGRVADLAPPAATTARTAEDTFAVLLPQTNSTRAHEVSRSLLRSFDTPFDVASRQVPFEASIGLAVRPTPDSRFGSAEKMLRASHSAMHQAQRQEGDNLKVYRPDDQREMHWLQRRERLREAIRQDELVLHYQPIVHLVSGDPVGAEALVRWNHPDRGLLSPAAFMPLAEETGLVEEIDRWVFSQVLARASTWTTSPNRSLDWLSVNVSPQSMEGDFQRWCYDKLREASVPDGSLHLEITERWALRDEESLRPLREEGMRLSIDDFGTGYSSLRYLRSLEADVLKIDREFIQDLGRDEKTTAIVQFLMNLSLRLDVEVIAEGVSTVEQEDVLRDLGCAMAQGHHFVKPMPADALLKHIGPSSS